LSYVRLANIRLKQVEPSGSAIKAEDLDSNAFHRIKELSAEKKSHPKQKKAFSKRRLFISKNKLDQFIK
jgi:hypothetical protein